MEEVIVTTVIFFSALSHNKIVLNTFFKKKVD